jgi:hypothetical protein
MSVNKITLNKLKEKNLITMVLPLLLMSALFISCDEFIDSDYRFEESYSRTIALKEPGSFSLENVNGEVTIKTSPAREVVIQATKYAKRDKSDLDKIRIEVVQGEKSVKVDTIYGRRNLRAKVDYDLTVPEGLSLELVKTVNGKIVVSGKYDRAQLKTTNGRIEVSGDFGWLEASTTNGSLVVAGVRGKINLRTTNGSIKAELDRLALGQEANAYLSARTVNGSLRLEYPVTVEGEVSRRKIEGKLGQGGEIRVSLEVTNGSISLVKL